MRKFSKFLCVLLTTSVMLLSSACFLFWPIDDEYDGEHPDLYTVAINSLLGSVGYASHGEWEEDSVITIIETDDFGRTLFMYTELAMGLFTQVDSYIVCQDSDKEYVYFYEDVNIYTITPSVYSGDPSDCEAIKVNLKDKNDWNKPIVIEKCARKKIVTKLPAIPEVFDDETLIDMFLKIEGEQPPNITVRYCTLSYCACDDYGRTAYLLSVDCHNSNTEEYGWEYHRYVMILEPNGTYNPDMFYSDITSFSYPLYKLATKEYQGYIDQCYSEYRVLKQRNNWNQPF
ncbi:MAG: hypothetical protein PHX51_07285 [Clostridia bacterium]|nr:hypothetical protein [Clostridia bacterium]